MGKKREKAPPAPVRGPFNNPFASLGDLLPTAPAGGAETTSQAATPGGATAPGQESDSVVTTPVEGASVDLDRVSGRWVLRIERKGHGGKTVTLVQGPGIPEEQATFLTRTWAKLLGVSARVGEAGQIQVAGDQRERLGRWLTTQGAKKVVLG